jgi:hypothetical protein
MEEGLNQDGQDLQISRIQDAMQHEMLTRRIIGCAMSVHRALGNGNAYFLQKYSNRNSQG